MKQMFLLEAKDLADLRAGKPFTINLGDGHTPLVLISEKSIQISEKTSQLGSEEATTPDNGSKRKHSGTIIQDVANILSKHPEGLQGYQIATQIAAHKSSVYAALGKHADLFEKTYTTGQPSKWSLKKQPTNQPELPFTKVPPTFRDRIVETLFKHPEGLRTREIGKILSVKRTDRVLGALYGLEKDKIVTQKGKTSARKWSIGPRA